MKNFLVAVAAVVIALPALAVDRNDDRVRSEIEFQGDDEIMHHRGGHGWGSGDRFPGWRDRGLDHGYHGRGRHGATVRCVADDGTDYPYYYGYAPYGERHLARRRAIRVCETHSDYPENCEILHCEFRLGRW